MTFLGQVSFKGYLPSNVKMYVSPTTGRELFRVLLATFEFATYVFVSLPIGKVQNSKTYSLGGASLKER